MAYGRSNNPFYATHYPNEYECSYWGTYPYYLSDSVPSVFEHEKVGNMKRGRYWVTLSGKNILSVYEIIEFTGDRFILNDNDPRYKRVYKANKRTKLSKLMKKKVDQRKISYDEKYISVKASRYLVVVFSIQLWLVYSRTLPAQSTPDSIVSFLPVAEARR